MSHSLSPSTEGQCRAYAKIFLPTGYCLSLLSWRLSNTSQLGPWVFYKPWSSFLWCSFLDLLNLGHYFAFAEACCVFECLCVCLCVCVFECLCVCVLVCVCEGGPSLYLALFFSHCVCHFTSEVMKEKGLKKHSKAKEMFQSSA